MIKKNKQITKKNKQIKSKIQKSRLQQALRDNLYRRKS